METELPKGLYKQRRTRADGSIAIYYRHRATGRRIRGEPGTPEFNISLDAIYDLSADERDDKAALSRRAYRERVHKLRVGDIIERAVFTAKYRKAAKLGFDLSRSFVRALIEEQRGVCAITGLRFDLTATGLTGARPFTPSLDRIDSTLGYVQGNVRVVCFAVNAAMGNWGEEVFLQIAAAALHKRFNGPSETKTDT